MSLLTNNDGQQLYQARKTPYRSGSNHNILIHEDDKGPGKGTLERRTNAQRAQLYEANGVTTTQKVHGYLLERRKEMEERRARGEVDNFEQELKAHVELALQREETNIKFKNPKKMVRRATISMDEEPTLSAAVDSRTGTTMDKRDGGSFQVDSFHNTITKKRTEDQFPDDLNVVKSRRTTSKPVTQATPQRKDSTQSRKSSFRLTKQVRNVNQVQFARNHISININTKKEKRKRMRTLNLEKENPKYRRVIEIIQDPDRQDILHVDGREVDKQNYPDGFDYNLIAGTKFLKPDLLTNYNLKAQAIKIGDPDKYKYNEKRLANDPKLGPPGAATGVYDRGHSLYITQKFHIDEQKKLDEMQRRHNLLPELNKRSPNAYDTKRNGNFQSPLAPARSKGSVNGHNNEDIEGVMEATKASLGTVKSSGTFAPRSFNVAMRATNVDAHTMRAGIQTAEAGGRMASNRSSESPIGLTEVASGASERMAQLRRISDQRTICTKDSGHAAIAHPISSVGSLNFKIEKVMPKVMPKKSLIPNKVQPILQKADDNKSPGVALFPLKTRNSFITDRRNTAEHHTRAVSHAISQYESKITTMATNSAVGTARNFYPSHETSRMETTARASTIGGDSTIRMQQVDNWWSHKKNFGRGWIRGSDHSPDSKYRPKGLKFLQK